MKSNAAYAMSTIVSYNMRHRAEYTHTLAHMRIISQRTDKKHNRYTHRKAFIALAWKPIIYLAFECEKLAYDASGNKDKSNINFHCIVDENTTYT